MDGVVLLDGDLQDPPELIEQFHERWEEGHDVIYGRRVRREMSWFSGMMYKLFYRIFAAFSPGPISENSSSVAEKSFAALMMSHGSM